MLPLQSRFLAFVRPLLGVPAVVLYGWPIVLWAGKFEAGFSSNSVVAIVTVSTLGLVTLLIIPVVLASWIFLLVTGRGLATTQQLVVLWWVAQVRTAAYLAFFSNAYPMRSASTCPKVVAPAGSRSRLHALFRFPLAAPHILLLWPGSILLTGLLVVRWVTAVSLGTPWDRTDRITAALLAWAFSVQSYISLLTDQYPAFPPSPATFASARGLQTPVERTALE